MAETPFLRPKYPAIPPHAAIGAISLSLCPDKGTRLRIDVMDTMCDIELDTLVNHYSIVTGPVPSGYYVVTYLHDVDNCKCIIGFVSLSPTNAVRIQFYQVNQGPAADAVVELDQDPIPSDNGVLVTRHSLIHQAQPLVQAMGLYGALVQTMGWQPLPPTKTKPINRHDLCNP